MAHASADGAHVNARILYWGTPGAGITSNLRFIHAKLRSDHRGELREVPTRLDPTVTYEVLPISLGEVNGVATQLQITAVPSDPPLVPTRKQLLDEVDGVVLVIDAQKKRSGETAASVEELRASLADYGRTLEEIPLVVQYNKRDLTEDYQVEALHRDLGLPSHAVFEAMAHQGKGVLKTLTTISKQVVRTLRTRTDAEGASGVPAEAVSPAAAPLPETVEVYDPEALKRRTAEPPQPAIDALAAAPEPSHPATAPSSPTVALSSRELMEEAILAEADEQGQLENAVAMEAEAALDRPWDDLASDRKPSGVRLGPDLRIVSVGTATREGQRSVRVPLVLGNDDGETVTVALSVAIDPLLDD